jgi:predicted DNA-binding protein YlxM (UPF0122 family)
MAQIVRRDEKRNALPSSGPFIFKAARKAGVNMSKGWKKSSAWQNSPQADAIAAFYVQGHSVRETAEKFGVQKYQVNNVVKTRRLSNGHSFREKGRNCLSKHNAKQKADAIDRIKARLESLGFEYISGYEKVRYRCKLCGNVQEHCRDHVRDGNVVCHNCEHEKTLIRQAQRKEELKQKRKKRINQKARAEAEKADALFHLLNDKTHVCTVCGKSFSIADYMESCGLKQIQHNPSYCSDACKRKANHRKSKECKKRSGNYDRGTHRRRAKKYGVPYEPGITLKKVWKRYKGVCQICGKPCDWSDRSWNKYCGSLYPSIDHIVALANGGGHVQSNVQLAHMMCNSEKGDSI